MKELPNTGLSIKPVKTFLVTLLLVISSLTFSGCSSEPTVDFIPPTSGPDRDALPQQGPGSAQPVTPPANE